MNSSEDIPIDIHYNKLLDWLINRRHCNQKWQDVAMVIREKINIAIQDMPPVEEITQLLHGTYINYFHCLTIVELLKATEDGTTNIFGRYSSQRMKDWIEIIKLYEKNGIYLAEVAQLLARNVNYEIPSLKRQIAKCQTVNNESSRKEGEYTSQAKVFKEKYHTRCKLMGIEGNKIKTELFELVKDLPQVYDKLGKESRNLKNASEYYTEFVRFTLGKEKDWKDCLPMVRYIIEKGNTTTFEWRTGRVPGEIKQTELDLRALDEEDDVDETKTEEIDWGDIEAGGDAIDYGISAVEGSEEQNLEIEVAETGAGDGIDWGDSAEQIDIQVADCTTPNQSKADVASGDDALTILDNTTTRNIFIDELVELEAFLLQRLQELEHDDSVITSNQFQSATQIVQQDARSVEPLVQDVLDILDQLTTDRIKDLFLIRSSPRYMDRLAESLRAILRDSEKMMSLSRLMVERRQEALDEQRATEPVVQLIRRKTKELQKQIEDEISKKYNNRRVHIMGEINTV